MKKFILMAASTIALVASLTYNSANAQVRVNVNFNVSSQPVWGPAGYDYARFYYLPDIGAYYNVTDRIFIINERGRWVYTSALPGRYRNDDLYRSYKVVINEPNPWLRHNVYRTRYASYRGRHNQPFIRDSRDEKYWVIRNHPRHGDWTRRHGNGNNDRRDDDRRYNDRRDNKGHR